MYSRSEVLKILSNDHRYFTSLHYGVPFHEVKPEQLIAHWDFVNHPVHWKEYVVDPVVIVEGEPFPLPPNDHIDLHLRK